jgi:hypothetical protein
MAIGIIPMMVAKEVIRMGRRRTRHAVMTVSATEITAGLVIDPVIRRDHGVGV